MKRVTMFVLNDCRTDARVLREAATLAAAGYAVTVMARTTDPYAASGEREMREGFTIVRVPVASGLLRWLHLIRSRLARLAGGRNDAVWAGAEPRRQAGGEPRQRSGRWDRVVWTLRWRFSVLPWARAVAAAAPMADILHAHDLRALPAAIRARGHRGSRRAPIVYDSHEIFVEAGAIATRSAAAKAAIRRSERELAGHVAALVTVNDEIGQILGPALGIDRVVVVHNCPPSREPPPDAAERLRRAAGVPDGAPLVLFHGGLSPERGIEQSLAAMRLPGLEPAHLVFMGFGPGRTTVERAVADPAFGGRIHALAPVPPGDVPDWVAGADVDLAPIQPTTLNHRLSTPNKVFESLAAGVPVVASDFAPLRRILLEDPLGPLGALCDPTDPASIAAALQGVLQLGAEERAALGARCLRAAHERWNWETESAKLLALYADLEGVG